MNGDKANPSDVHIYDAAAKSWTTQKVTTGTFDPSSFDAILDHDTNVFYAVSKGELFFLDMGSLTAANSTALSWTDVSATPYGSDYQTVMALAQNHIHFLDVPGNAAGVADIFVIHCQCCHVLYQHIHTNTARTVSFFQPQSQEYSGTAFPASHGQTASFFQTSGVQQEFAFIPDDGSTTYVINVETNSTSTLAGPTTKDAKAIYAASITALVQVDSTGAVSFIPYTQGNDATNSAAAWASVAKIAAVAPAGSSSTASGASGTASGSTATGTKASTSGTGSAASSSSTGSSGSGDSSGALSSSTVSLGAVAGALIAALAATL